MSPQSRASKIAIGAAMQNRYRHLLGMYV